VAGCASSSTAPRREVAPGNRAHGVDGPSRDYCRDPDEYPELVHHALNDRDEPAAWHRNQRDSVVAASINFEVQASAVTGVERSTLAATGR
jgi:hypothetical protein